MARKQIENKKIKDLNPFVNPFHNGLINGSEDLYIEYKNLLMNAVQIEGLDYQIETFVKNNLIECGAVGYDALTNEWANVYGEGINKWGNPTTLTFVFKNGKSYTREAYYEANKNGAYKINALPDTYALGIMIKKTTNFMENCDVAINQNINACKTPYIVVCKDKDLQLSIEHAIEDKQDGKPVIVVSEDIGEGLKSININVDYIADKILTIRDVERDKLLNKIGIMSANINKRERVQVGEVNATVGQCEDYIYLLIDTFNKQMETYGLPFKMKLNGSLEALYDESEDDNENVDENENITEIIDKEGANND